jgi:hypothetical protein
MRMRSSGAAFNILKQLGFDELRLLIEDWNPRIKAKESLVGRRFGRLTVTEFFGSVRLQVGFCIVTVWVCRCDCGNVIPASTTYLTNNKEGSVKSCGCVGTGHKKPKPRNAQYLKELTATLMSFLEPIVSAEHLAHVESILEKL